MNKKKYRGGLIGCGYASGFQLDAWSRIEDAEIVALSSRNRANAQQRADEFSISMVYTNYLEMLGSETLDFVDIATPPVVHLEMISEAAKRGYSVLCQKPIAETLQELREMIRACDDAGVSFMVNENGRFQPWYRKMKDLIDEGMIGSPFYANLTSRSRYTLPYMDPTEDQATLLTNMPRLVIYELGVHYLDTLRYLFGEATSVYCLLSQISPQVQGEDLATLIVRFNKLIAVVDMSWASVPVEKYEKIVGWGNVRIEGEQGTIHFTKDGLLRLITDDGETSFQFPEDSETIGYQGAQQHFIDCLRSKREAETSGHETIKTMELVFGAYRAATNNQVYWVGRDFEHLD